MVVKVISSEPLLINHQLFRIYTKKTIATSSILVLLPASNPEGI